MLAIDKDVFTQLSTWYQAPLGQALADAIAEQLEPELANFFGYHLLQLGSPCNPNWLAASPIPNHICLASELMDPHTGICADYGALPFANGSIDVAVLPHTLGFVTNPQQVLAEVDRILVSDGHMIIIGFNPVSLWGAWRLFGRYKGVVPWTGNFISTFRLRRYLQNIGYKIERIDSFFQRPPVKSRRWLSKLLFLETMGRISWLYPGAAYILVAQKHTAGITPIRPIWRFKNLVIGKRYVEPSTFNHL